MALRLLVTTSEKAGPEQVSRAQLVAARCGGTYRSRRGSLARILADADLAYVVGRDRDALRTAEAQLSVHQGMLAARRQSGLEHPLLRALGPADRVVDGTLGLAGDALHIADGLGAEVLGIEGSGPIFSLLEEGLPRLAREGLDAAGRIRITWGRATEVLAGWDADSADAVFLAPMYATPRAANPGFELLRMVAIGDPLDQALLDASLRVAPRVVVKADRGIWPAGLSPAPRCVRGRSVDYLVFARGSLSR